MRLLAFLTLVLLSASITSAQENADNPDNAEKKRILGKPVAEAPNDEAAIALHEARTFRKRGEFAKALERHEWYHANALRINPAYYGVRLSFALSDWMVLANQYPPALASLKRIRDTDTRTIGEGKGTPALFHDVVSINGKFSEQAASISLFKKLDAAQPDLAKQCFRIMDDTLIEEGELDLYSKYVGDPKAYLAQEIALFDRTTTHLRKSSPRAEESIAHFKNKLIGVTLTLAKIATDKGDPALATELKAMTAKVVPDPRLAQ